MTDDLPALLRTMADGRAAEADLLRHLADRLDAPTLTATPDFISPAEAARLSSLSRRTISLLAQRGDLPSRRYGSRLLIEAAGLRRYLATLEPGERASLIVLTDQRRRERA